MPLNSTPVHSIGNSVLLTICSASAKSVTLSVLLSSTWVLFLNIDWLGVQQWREDQEDRDLWRRPSLHYIIPMGIFGFSRCCLPQDEMGKIKQNYPHYDKSLPFLCLERKIKQANKRGKLSFSESLIVSWMKLKNELINQVCNRQKMHQYFLGYTVTEL